MINLNVSLLDWLKVFRLIDGILYLQRGTPHLCLVKFCQDVESFGVAWIGVAGVCTHRLLVGRRCSHVINARGLILSFKLY